MTDVFDPYYKEYDAWYDKNRPAYLSELETIKKVLPGGKGLEIGVGTGRFASQLGVEVGIDPSRKMVETARARGITAMVGNGEDLPFGQDEFDFVLIITTLCFVNEPKRVIEESRRVLKKKGKIIVGIIDKNSFLGKFYDSKKSKFYKKARFFSAEEVVDLLKQTGFSNFCFYQSIFKFPEQIKEVESPEPDHGKGGFVVICAEK